MDRRQDEGLPVTPEARIIARLVMAAKSVTEQVSSPDRAAAIAEGEAYLAALPPSLAFTAFGKAQTKGSASAFIPKGWKRAIVTNANPRNKAWEKVVAESATLALVDLSAEHRMAPADRMLLGPATLAVDFFLPRPQRVKVDEPHTSPGDLDKLCRSVGDSLTGVLWQDDAQVDVLIARKGYAAPGTVPRAEIAVSPTLCGR